MAAQNNATCSICGKPYYKCLSCRDAAKLQPWKMYTDSAEHYKVLQAIRGYNTGVYTKDELKFKLKNIDLSDLESYKEHIKALIKNTLKDDEPVEIKVEEDATDENVMVECVETIAPRKRNYKANIKIEEE